MRSPHIQDRNAALVRFSLCPEFKSPVTHVLCDLWQVAQLLCASATVWVLFTPFLTGRLGGLTVREHV